MFLHNIPRQLPRSCSVTLAVNLSGIINLTRDQIPSHTSAMERINTVSERNSPHEIRCCSGYVSKTPACRSRQRGNGAAGAGHRALSSSTCAAVSITGLTRGRIKQQWGDRPDVLISVRWHAGNAAGVSRPAQLAPATRLHKANEAASSTPRQSLPFFGREQNSCSRQGVATCSVMPSYLSTFLLLATTRLITKEIRRCLSA